MMIFVMLLSPTGHSEWKTLSESSKRKHIVYLQNELEVADRTRRMKAIRSFLYIVQGNVRPGQKKGLFKKPRHYLELNPECDF